ASRAGGSGGAEGDRRGGVVSGGSASSGARTGVVGRQAEARPIDRTTSGLRGLLWLWWLALRNELPARRPVQVQPLVWLGGIPTPRRWRALRHRGVTRALSLLGEMEPPTWVSDADHLLWLRVADRFAPTLEQLVDAADFLDHSVASQTGVLVFCGSGIGRAPTAYAAWCMRRVGSDAG